MNTGLCGAGCAEDTRVEAGDKFRVAENFDGVDKEKCPYLTIRESSELFPC